MNENNAECEAFCREELAAHPHWTEEEQQYFCENMALCFNYPGQFVAYLDTWNGAGGNSAPLVRTILAHNADPLIVQAELGERLDEAEVTFRYIEGPRDTDEPHADFMEWQAEEAS